MNICLFEPDEIQKPLKAQDSRAVHLKKILHKKVGDEFAAGIINQAAGSAKITKIEPAGPCAGDIHFEFAPQSDGKPLFPLHMIIGFPRPIQLKRLLRDIGSLGVQSVHLCATELGEKSYLESRLSDPQEIRKMLLDGTIQAGSVHVPHAQTHPSLAECLRSVQAEFQGAQTNASSAPQDAGPLKIALDNVSPDQSLCRFLEQNPPNGRPVIAAIGSERGWTDKERRLLRQNGFALLGMGSRILRTETASTVAASLILSKMSALG